MNAHFFRARAAMDLNRWVTAHEAILLALAEDSQNPLFHALRAEICYRQREFAESRAAAREAIALDPDWNEGYYWLAWSLMVDFIGESDRDVKLTEIADRALECSPSDADCHHLRANVANFNNNTFEVIQFASSGLECDPEHLGCLRMLGKAQRSLSLRAIAPF